ncbi:hypothetical protein ACUL41_14380 [Virgibacillus natechei]|uniref:hypothetical protein n=1 Tax=Virgibacillus sp. CBA3643 TaxID=2942278 RepID=UPI0035A2C9AC
MKKMGMFFGLILISFMMAACNNANDDIADDDSHSEDESENRSEENTEVTEEDAPGKVFDYVDEHEDIDSEDVNAMVQDDEAQMTNTIGWYLVNKETGEVEEKEF